MNLTNPLEGCKDWGMPRQPRLDAPGTLHHIMGRGIERTKVVRSKRVSRVRRLFCQLAVGKMGYPAAEVARLLGVTTSAVARATNSEDLPEIDKYT